jgi:hypothetical protein
MDVLANAPLAPLGPEEQQRLAELVHAGHAAWSAFHGRFAEQQQNLRRQDPGLASWEDLAGFLRQFADARSVEGFRTPRFEAVDDRVEPADAPADALAFDECLFALGDDGGMPATGHGGEQTRPLGMNLDVVAEALRRHGFLGSPGCAAHLRWPSAVPLPATPPFGVLAFLRQTPRTRESGWEEHGCRLWVYLVAEDAEPIPVEGDDKAQLLRGVFAAGVGIKPATPSSLDERLRRAEAEVPSRLRPPSDRQREANLRHAVGPLFAAITEP